MLNAYQPANRAPSTSMFSFFGAEGVMAPSAALVTTTLRAVDPVDILVAELKRACVGFTPNCVGIMRTGARTHAALGATRHTVDAARGFAVALLRMETIRVGAIIITVLIVIFV